MFTVILTRQVMNEIVSTLTLNVKAKDNDEAAHLAEQQIGSGWKANKVKKGSTRLE